MSKFSIRDLLWLTAVVAVLLWALFVKSGAPGRYAMLHNPGQGQTFLFDSTNGQCWVRDASGAWTDTAAPPSKKK